MVMLALPYLHQLFDGRFPKASVDLFVTAELLGTVLGATVEEEVTIVAAVVAIVASTGGTTGVLLLLLAHTPSPVTEIQLPDCELHDISTRSDLSLEPTPSPHCFLYGEAVLLHSPYRKFPTFFTFRLSPSQGKTAVLISFLLFGKSC
jgi:hypothetical protein